MQKSIIQKLESIKVILSIKIIWRFFPKKLHESLRNYVAIEADSCWQLLNQFKKTQNPTNKLRLFQQAIEERKHSELFLREYKKLTKTSAKSRIMKREAVIKKSQSESEFYSYCFVGEQFAAERFFLIQNNLPEGSLKRTFRRILKDEAKHMHSAKFNADEVGVDLNTFLKANRKFIWQRRKQAWLEQGQVIVAKAGLLILALTYIVIGPFATLQCRRRLWGHPIKRNFSE